MYSATYTTTQMKSQLSPPPESCLCPFPSDGTTTQKFLCTPVIVDQCVWYFSFTGMESYSTVPSLFHGQCSFGGHSVSAQKRASSFYVLAAGRWVVWKDCTFVVCH